MDAGTARCGSFGVALRDPDADAVGRVATAAAGATGVKSDTS